MRAITSLLFSLLAWIFLLGGFPTPAAPKQQSVPPTLSPAAGKALVYVMRERGLQGGNAPEPVSIDEVSWGSLRRGYYLVAQIEPGQHAVEVRGSSSYEINLVSGKTYYYSFEGMPWLDAFIFRELNKADGKKRIGRAKISPDNKLAHTLVPGTQPGPVTMQQTAPSVRPQEKPPAVIHPTATAPPASPSVTAPSLDFGSYQALTPVPGKGLVYLMREHVTHHTSAPEPVLIDDIFWGTLRPNAYLAGQIDPGPHLLSVGGFAPYKINLVAGKTYYYSFEHRSVRVHFRQISEAKGRKWIGRHKSSPDNKLAHTLVAGIQHSPVTIQPTAPSVPPKEKPPAVIQPTTPSLPQEKPAAVIHPTATAPPTSPSETAPSFDFGSYQALIIGNNKYQVLPHLRTAGNDARSMAKLLEEKYGFRTELIFDATRADILRAISQYRRTLTGRDNLLIYYAGHGWLDKDADEGYWLPVDAGEQDPTNWVSNSSITTALRAMQAKHILVVADSCYSGKLARGINIRLRTSDYYEKICRKKARTVMASGGIEPVADRGSKGEHSVFASALIEALSENEGVLDATLLFSKIRRPVMLNADQTPEYSDIRKAGHDGGDFLFVPVK